MPTMTVSADNLKSLCDAALETISKAENEEPFQQGTYNAGHHSFTGARGTQRPSKERIVNLRRIAQLASSLSPEMPVNLTCDDLADLCTATFEAT